MEQDKCFWTDDCQISIVAASQIQDTVRPDVGIKISQNFPIVAKEVTKVFFYNVTLVIQNSQNVGKYLGYSSNNLIAKNFQNPPNLVTLQAENLDEK